MVLLFYRMSPPDPTENLLRVKTATFVSTGAGCLECVSWVEEDKGGRVGGGQTGARASGRKDGHRKLSKTIS